MNNTKIIEILKPLGYVESKIKNNETFIILIERMIENIICNEESIDDFDYRFEGDVSTLDKIFNDLDLDIQDSAYDIEEMFSFEGLEIIRQVEHLTFEEVNEVIGE
ncbi:hypothetical protein [Vibrio penaeicida]|uniref:hypothetical protein n=1 Tax=Vibrio penaeicida TaxID=104609 RepID=UPI001CC6EA2F|nr:hypothetical protein [Vibrio penaeicida]